MAFYSGSSGSLLIDGKKAARVKSWQISTSVGMLDATSLEQTDKVVTPGIRNSSGRCEIFYYTTNPNQKTDNSASELLNVVIKARTGENEGIAAETDSVKLRLKIDDGTTDGKYVEVEAFITSAQMSMAVGQVLSAQISFDVNGAPLLVNI
jgi:hypothetical protein